mmetsp:Transcript_1239/g.2005  ORF Transcript_1239/g.2005 Transcript_1239/m.2005 type:complete len:100 (-) Transcript_1239:257-556(-)
MEEREAEFFVGGAQAGYGFYYADTSSEACCYDLIEARNDFKRLGFRGIRTSAVEYSGLPRRAVAKMNTALNGDICQCIKSICYLNRCELVFDGVYFGGI